MFYDDCVILLYAKAPVAGKVNTRLIDDIGVDAATKLQHDLIHHRLSMLSASNLCDVRLMCAPDQNDKTFLLCKSKYGVTLFDQQGNDLGKRMFNGAEAALKNYKYCVIIGTDAPALDAQKIKQALDAVRGKPEVVFVPAEDGGYVLLAMRQAYTFLFENISWGSAAVMQQSRQQLKQHAVVFEELASCWDVDRLEDYQRYLKFIAN